MCDDPRAAVAENALNRVASLLRNLADVPGSDEVTAQLGEHADQVRQWATRLAGKVT